jgi:hypothetical protein
MKSKKYIQNLKDRFDEIVTKNQENIALEKVTLKQLKDKFECINLKEGKELLQELIKDKKKMESKFEKQIEELEKQMEELEI